MRTTCFLVFSISWFFSQAQGLVADESFDVVVYGGTPAGISAALAACAGTKVLLIEPTQRLGGLVTSGLSHTDFHSLESLNGTYLNFAKRVEAHYQRTYGKDSPQVRACFHGTFAEPKVNLATFEGMLAEQTSIAIWKQHYLLEVKCEQQQIRSLLLQGPKAPRTVLGKVFIDATYEGDLLAKAGVPFRVGRESRSEWNESLAPEKADEQLQAYNFRWIMTRDPANRVMPNQPEGYKREDFLPVLHVLASGKIKTIFGYPKDCIFKAQTPVLPNGKYDINDVSNGLIRLSLPGKNLGWPNGDLETRNQIFADHLRDQVGLLYFLQNDPDVPASFREEARQWGWCKDEFIETNHMPPQLYVREARRMQGSYIFKQSDSQHAPNDARAILHRDAIAMGDYGNNCHGTFHEGPRFGGKHTGEFYNPVPPYQIPYGVLHAKECSNLFVPVAVSSTHVGFCALRLEPIWMSLGQAAGHAARMVVEKKCTVQQVPIPELQQRLHADGSATIYVSDVLPGHTDFALVQWWGTLGGWHGLAPMPAKPGQRGKNLHGQYYEANPGHSADLTTILEESLAKRWNKLAQDNGIRDPLPQADGRLTRGEWLRKVWKIKQGK